MSTTPETLSLTDFCAFINVKRSYGVQLKNEGRLVMAECGKLVRVAESVQRIEATRDPSKRGVAQRHADQRGAPATTGHDTGDDADDGADAPAQPAASAGRGPQYDYQGSKAKKEHFAAAREHDQYRKEAGELIEHSRHVAALSAIGVLVRTKLEGWAATLPPQLAGREEADVRRMIMERVEDVLQELSAQARALAAQEAGDA